MDTCVCSPPAPENVSMAVWLCVPLIHWLRARNWNFASSGMPLTAPIVAKSLGVSTPFKGAGSRRTVVGALMSCLLCAALMGGLAVSPPFHDKRARNPPQPVTCWPDRVSGGHPGGPIDGVVVEPGQCRRAGDELQGDGHEQVPQPPADRSRRLASSDTRRVGDDALDARAPQTVVGGECVSRRPYVT